MYRRDRCIDLLKEPVDEFGNDHRPMIHHYEVCLQLEGHSILFLFVHKGPSEIFFISLEEGHSTKDDRDLYS